MPPRPYDDPANAEFIADVKRSRVPVELQAVDDRRRPIPVQVCCQPKVKI